MSTAIFTPLAKYKTPGKADVVFGTTNNPTAFETTSTFTDPVIYATIESIRCPCVNCSNCPLNYTNSICDEISALTIFPQFVTDFPELCV